MGCTTLGSGLTHEQSSRLQLRPIKDRTPEDAKELPPGLILPLQRLSVDVSAQEQPISRIPAFVLVRIAKLFQKRFKLYLVLRRHLHADEHPAVICAVVAIMKEADVPAAAHRVEKPHERAWPLRELEAVEDLVAYTGR